MLGCFVPRDFVGLQGLVCHYRDGAKGFPPLPRLVSAKKRKRLASLGTSSVLSSLVELVSFNPVSVYYNPYVTLMVNL